MPPAPVPRSRRNAVYSRNPDSAPLLPEERVLQADEIRLFIERENLLLRITLDSQNAQPPPMSRLARRLRDLVYPNYNPFFLLFLIFDAYLFLGFMARQQRTIAGGLSRLSSLAVAVLAPKSVLAMAAASAVALWGRHLERAHRATLVNAYGPCVVCQTEAKTMAFAACGHLCCCATCVQAIAKHANPSCPLCRQPVTAERPPLRIYV